MCETQLFSGKAVICRGICKNYACAYDDTFLKMFQFQSWRGKAFPTHASGNFAFINDYIFLMASTCDETYVCA